jgi:flagellar biosynthesis chaperone FliJ
MKFVSNNKKMNYGEYISDLYCEINQLNSKLSLLEEEVKNLLDYLEFQDEQKDLPIIEE